MSPGTRTSLAAAHEIRAFLAGNGQRVRAEKVGRLIRTILAQRQMLEKLHRENLDLRGNGARRPRREQP